MSQSQKPKINSSSKTPQSFEKEQASFDSRLFSDTSASMDSTKSAEMGYSAGEAKGDPHGMDRFPVNRYRQLTMGLAMVYFIWLVFLAWIAFTVLTG